LAASFLLVAANAPAEVPFGIHLEVRDGVAILSGTVDTIQDMQRAELDAFAAGAVGVENNLNVRSQ
jgi:osmotically-inducible protein OsmY